MDGYPVTRIQPGMHFHEGMQGMMLGNRNMGDGLLLSEQIVPLSSIPGLSGQGAGMPMAGSARPMMMQHGPLMQAGPLIGGSQPPMMRNSMATQEIPDLNKGLYTGPGATPGPDMWT